MVKVKGHLPPHNSILQVEDYNAKVICDRNVLPGLFESLIWTTEQRRRVTSSQLTDWLTMRVAHQWDMCTERKDSEVICLKMESSGPPMSIIRKAKE